MSGPLAITGATGFVGQCLVRLARERGIPVRALTRRPQPAAEGVEWVEGALDTPASLARLAEGASALIHVAAAVNAPGRDAFTHANVAGTQAILAAAQEAGVRRFVHVSSLAAREPALSAYGGSKAGAEDAVRLSGLDWTMVRPPAVFGPRDTEMLELFRMARRGFVLLPPRGRLSVIAVDDLCRLLLACVPARDAVGAVYEPDDGTQGGWDHPGFARAIGAALGRRVLPLPLPGPLLTLGARGDRLVRRGAAKLTPDRVRYFLYPDWVADPRKAPPLALWHPMEQTPAALARTVAWYRAEGWL